MSALGVVGLRFSQRMKVEKDVNFGEALELRLKKGDGASYVGTYGLGKKSSVNIDEWLKLKFNWREVKVTDRWLWIQIKFAYSELISAFITDPERL